MSSRSRLGTVLRVAELRERVARGAAGRDIRAAHEAAEAEQARRARLAAPPPSGGFRMVTTSRALRAGAVVEAAGATEVARQQSRQSVARYVDAAQRSALLSDLVARKAAEHELAVIAADQRLVDDLGAGQKGLS